jgi:hypothetical protein
VRDDEVLSFLWRGVLADLVLDLCFGELSFSVQAPLDDDHDVVTHVSRHRLRFRGLLRLNLMNDIEFPWNYALLEQLRLSRVDGTEFFQFEMYLWSESATMTGVFEQLLVDDAPVSIDVVMPPY